MSSDWAVRARGLWKTYHVYARPQDRLKQIVFRGRRRFHHDVVALRDVSFEVARGETVGIVGRNGCGKSTLLEIVAGTLAPTAGEIEVRGRVAALLELGSGFNPEFTGRENVVLSAALFGLSRRQIEERFDRIVDFADIGPFLDQPVKTYSSGMYMRLAFATAIHVDSQVLVIDEALAVGDEAFQRKCISRLFELRERGTTLLFVSHSAAAIVELCDRAILLDGGERLLTGAPKLVVTRYQKLVYAPPERRDAIRDEIRALDARLAAGASAAEAVPGPSDAPAPPPAEEAHPTFDPSLVSRTAVPYASRGARVEEVTLVDARGERVNLLTLGEVYRVRLRVRFDKPAFRVRFGTTVTTLNGVDLCGMMSHPEGEAVDYVEAGALAEVRFRFVNRLLPGVYFLRAGCTAVEDGEEIFLHRVADAFMFRVLPERGLSVIGLVDLSEPPPCEIRIAADGEMPS